MALNFPDDLIFGIPEIDDQHKKTFEMYNEFSEALDDGRGEEGVLEFFARLENITLSHFRYEERLIEKSSYPNAEVHLQEHIQTIDDLKQFKSMIKSEKLTKELLLSIKRHMIRLLINHCKTCDVRLCKHLLELKESHCPDKEFAAAGNKDKMIGEILVGSNIISGYTLELALDKQKETREKLGAVLIGMGAVKAEDIVEARAVQIGMLG